jgi:hypothetical protein
MLCALTAWASLAYYPVTSKVPDLGTVATMEGFYLEIDMGQSPRVPRLVPPPPMRRLPVLLS